MAEPVRGKNSACHRLKEKKYRKRGEKKEKKGKERKKGKRKKRSEKKEKKVKTEKEGKRCKLGGKLWRTSGKTGERRAAVKKITRGKM